MHIPSSTYRIQLSPSFTFKELGKIIPYLHRLGVSTIYSAPFFQSRPGSTHGYDVVNPLIINDEIGTLDEFQGIIHELDKLGMNWLQDIVPNHMAYDSRNKWLAEIFERGPQSEFYEFFDIDWEYYEPDFSGKAMAPFLGDKLEEVINQEALKLHYDEAGFSFSYYEHRYPASDVSYAFVLEKGRQFLEKVLGSHDKTYHSYMKIFQEFKVTWDDKDIWEKLKGQLHGYTKQYSVIQEALLSGVDSINGDQRLMKQLLEKQYFKLTHWKETEKKINYRRFFTINDLICLRMEDDKVFNRYHEFIKKLYDKKLITGLRIDHVDGLFDPPGYLQKLRKHYGEEAFIVIEKILEWEESLPSHWPVQGTSGYVFLALVNQLFTWQENVAKFSKAYSEIVPDMPEYESLVYENKRFILRERMGGELQNLVHLMSTLDLMPEGQADQRLWAETLNAFLAAFPVYRIYADSFPLNNWEKEVIGQAFSKSLQFNPGLKDGLSYLKQLFMGEANKKQDNMAYFLQRCQQFTGPLAAKGVEDTSFYIYNRLISHNEVGDSPEVFGVPAQYFHDRMLRRNERFPHSISATATHDTKRGEDARMRINVLSEIPDEWFEKVREWQKINQPLKENPSVPDSNEEYFIYQALIGAYALEKDGGENLLERTKEYLEKVLREAKVHSSWSGPDTDYEQSVFDFLQSILTHNVFLQTFVPFVRKIAHYGSINALSQCIIKITAPGIPDIYQGTELWDLSYVDPDNRRPIDFNMRTTYLQEMDKKSKNDELKLIKQLMQNYSNGKIKMYTLFKSLMERKKRPQLFKEGDYIPLEISGKSDAHAISYARSLDKDWYIVIAPRMLTSVTKESEFPLGDQTWGNDYINLPEEAPYKWINIFTDDKISVSGKLYLHEALAHFPVALLWGES